MKKKKIISQICIHVILVALTAICLLPFLSMISTSFMKVKGVLPNEPILFPNFPLYLENYVKAWTANHFQTYFFNTLYVSVVGLIVNLLISITMAYSFSRFQFPGKEPIFNLLLLTMMIPAQLAMISQYTVLNGLKLIDTYKGIWLLWGGTCVAGNTFFYRGFFEAVPKELEESMYLDGATRFQTLLHCIIPLSKPAVVYGINQDYLEIRQLQHRQYWRLMDTGRTYLIFLPLQNRQTREHFPLHCNCSVDSIRRTMA